MYDAFISYRHSDPDRFVAENLHKKLEAFRLPKSLVKQRGDDCKKKIERVFRDRDELPLATNLADPITQALENSEFLIVICSPRLPQSLWCKKEIETFIAMHGREHVLAVLAEGEPEEAFPPELLYRERKITAEDGTTQIVKEPVEPLAADVRGTTRKEILKKIDEELLRLAAAMFDCGYDDLKQRHKEQKMKKMLTVSLSASAVFLLFGAVSTTMAIRIQAQKEQIRQQSEEITAQKEEIETQYAEALYNQSLSMAEKSLELLEEGDRLGALELAYQALGETADGTPMPITAEAQYALAESSYLYQDGKTLEPMYMFKHDSNISLMQTSPGKDKLLTADLYNNICIWDIQNHQILAEISGEDVRSVSEDDCFFINDNQIILDRSGDFEIYDIEKQEAVYSYSGEGYFIGGKSQSDGKYFAVVIHNFKNETLFVYNGETFEEIYSYQIPEDRKMGSKLFFDKDGKRLVFDLREKNDTEQGSVLEVMDLYTGEIQGEFSVEYAYVECLYVLDDILYAGVSQSLEEARKNENFSINGPFKSMMYAIDLKDMTSVWEHRNEEKSLKDFQINKADYSRHILVSYFDEAHLLNLDTGVFEKRISFGEAIITTLYYLDSDNFAVLTRDGVYHFIQGKDGADFVREGYFHANSDDLKQVLPAENGYLSLPYNDCNVTYFEFAEGTDYEEIVSLEGYVREVYVNAGEDRMVILCSGDLSGEKKIFLLDLKTGKFLNEIPTEGFSVGAGKAGEDDEEFFVLTDEIIKLYAMEDGSLLAEYELPEGININYYSTSTDGESLIIRDAYDMDFYRISLADGTYEMFTMDYAESKVLAANMNHDFTVFARTDKEKNAILLQKIQDEEPFRTIDVKAFFVQEMLFTKDNTKLFVYFLDGSSAMYEVESGACLQKYPSFGKEFYDFTDLEGESGYLVKARGGSFLLNENCELIAKIPKCAAVLQKTGKWIGEDQGILYMAPLYPLEKLLEKAEQILTELHVVP